MRAGCMARRRALLAAVAATATLALMLATAASASASFSARGSAKQVYVTGLAPSARVSLLNRAGRRVARKRADSLGGVLFRNVKPGTGYRVRLSGGGAKSEPLTVLSTRAKPRSTDFYKQ